MINAKKLLTKAAATVTCVAMLASNGLSAFAAGVVTIDTSLSDQIEFEGEITYSIETPDYWFWYDDENGVANISADSKDQFGMEEGSIINLGGKLSEKLEELDN